MSQECPWLPSCREPAKEVIGIANGKKLNEKDFGTGSLVYEDKELNDLLVMLDSHKT